MTPLTNEVEHLDYKHLHAEAPRAVNDNDDLHTQSDCIVISIYNQSNGWHLDGDDDDDGMILMMVMTMITMIMMMTTTLVAAAENPAWQ